MVNYATWCITLILLILFFFQVGCSWLPVCTRPGTWQCSSSVVWSDTSWSISLSCVTRHCAHHTSWSLSLSVDSQLLSCRSSCDLAEQRVLEQESDHQPHVSTNQRWVLFGSDQSVTSILQVKERSPTVIISSIWWRVECLVLGWAVFTVTWDCLHQTQSTYHWQLPEFTSTHSFPTTRSVISMFPQSSSFNQSFGTGHLV